jgi:hypothetical protein
MHITAHLLCRGFTIATVTQRDIAAEIPQCAVCETSHLISISRRTHANWTPGPVFAATARWVCCGRRVHLCEAECSPHHRNRQARAEAREVEVFKARAAGLRFE